MTKAFITIFLFIFIVSPSNSDELSAVVGNTIITKKQIHSFTTYSLRQSGLNITPDNISIYFPIAKYRLIQNAILNDITKYIQVDTDDYTINTYLKYQKIPYNNVHLIRYVKTMFKWINYRDRIIVSNIKQPTLQYTQNRLMRQVSIISLPIVSSNSGLKALQHIRKKIIAGHDFSTLARNFSNDISWLDLGDIGWVAKNQTPYKIDSMIWSLSVGQVSPIFKIGGNHIVLKVISEDIYKNILKIQDSKQSTIQNNAYLLQIEQMRIINDRKQSLEIVYNND